MLSAENQEKVNANIIYINSLTKKQLFELFKSGKCPYEPEHLIGIPLGMFHCEICGIMICAGMPHGSIKWIGEFETGYADYPDEVYLAMNKAIEKESSKI